MAITNGNKVMAERVLALTTFEDIKKEDFEALVQISMLIHSAGSDFRWLLDNLNFQNLIHSPKNIKEEIRPLFGDLISNIPYNYGIKNAYKQVFSEKLSFDKAVSHLENALNKGQYEYVNFLLNEGCVDITNIGKPEKDKFFNLFSQILGSWDQQDPHGLQCQCLRSMSTVAAQIDLDRTIATIKPKKIDDIERTVFSLALEKSADTAIQKLKEFYGAELGYLEKLGRILVEYRFSEKVEMKKAKDG